jgi:hypothetical protein
MNLKLNMKDIREETGKTINMSQVTDQHTVVSRTTRHE